MCCLHITDGIYHFHHVIHLNRFDVDCVQLHPLITSEKALSLYWFRCLGQMQCVPNELWQHVYHTTPHSDSHPRCLQNQQTALLSPPTPLNQNRPRSTDSLTALRKSQQIKKFISWNDCTHYPLSSDSDTHEEVKTYHSSYWDEISIHRDNPELDYLKKWHRHSYSNTVREI